MRASSASSSANSIRSRRACGLLPLVASTALVWSVAADGAEAHVEAGPVLVVDNSFALDTTDPQRAFDPTSVIVDRAVYDTLFTFAKNDVTRPVPLLVRSWTSTGARRFTFRLKRGGRARSGRPG